MPKPTERMAWELLWEEELGIKGSNTMSDSSVDWLFMELGKIPDIQSKLSYRLANRHLQLIGDSVLMELALNEIGELRAAIEDHETLQNARLKRYGEDRDEIDRLRAKSYPHMCKDGHEEIGHRDSEHEMCPMCGEIATRDELLLVVDELLLVVKPFAEAFCVWEQGVLEGPTDTVSIGDCRKLRDAYDKVVGDA